jgi:hypothetical protein
VLRYEPRARIDAADSLAAALDDHAKHEPRVTKLTTGVASGVADPPPVIHAAVPNRSTTMQSIWFGLVCRLRLLGRREASSLNAKRDKELRMRPAAVRHLVGGTLALVALGGTLAATGLWPLVAACSFTASAVTTYVLIQRKKNARSQ